MNHMVEQESDGVKVNIPLAVALVGWMVSILVGGLWLGRELQATTSAVDALKRDQQQQAADDRDIELRLRTVETSRVASDSEIAALRRDLTDFRGEIRDLANLLRNLERRQGGTP